MQAFTVPDGRKVLVFDGDYSKELCADVAATAAAAIKAKGTFSLCIPGGSVVSESSAFFW